MIEAFKKYVNNYDLNDEKIKMKYEHSFRVMELNKKYATMLGLSNEDIEIATIIGLLHDIGRFEQLKVYHTFNDFNSVDHADYSVEQLFDNDLIKEFCSNEKWYPIIKFAIKNHNKLVIENCNDERKLLHARLIKDSDKVDIIYLLGTLGELNQKCTSDKLSPELLKIFKEKKLVPRDKCKNKNDMILAQFAFVFDIYNDICLKEYREYIINFYNRMNGGEQFKEVIEIVLNYIDERLEKYGNEY